MPRATISIIELQIARSEKEARGRISNSTNRNMSSIIEKIIQISKIYHEINRHIQDLVIIFIIYLINKYT